MFVGGNIPGYYFDFASVPRTYDGNVINFVALGLRRRDDGCLVDGHGHIRYVQIHPPGHYHALLPYANSNAAAVYQTGSYPAQSPTANSNVAATLSGDRSESTRGVVNTQPASNVAATSSVDRSVSTGGANSTQPALNVAAAFSGDGSASTRGATSNEPSAFPPGVNHNEDASGTSLIAAFNNESNNDGSSSVPVDGSGQTVTINASNINEGTLSA